MLGSRPVPARGAGQPALIFLVIAGTALAQQAPRSTHDPIANPAAAASSIHRNMTGRYIGMGQQVINRTPDNATGVYWNMYNANQARLMSTYGHANAPGLGNPDVLYDLELRRLMLLQDQAARLARRTDEIERRQQIRARSSTGASTSTPFAGSDMLGMGPGFLATPVVGGFNPGAAAAYGPVYGAVYGPVYGPTYGPVYGYDYSAPAITGYPYSPVGGYGYDYSFGRNYSPR